MDTVKQIIGAIAPTIATLLGGPLAGLAVDAIGKAIGLEAPTIKTVTDALTKAPLTGDQIVAMKVAENAVLIRVKELDIDLDKIDAADRDSARKRESEVKDNTNKVLAYVIVLSFIFVVTGVLFGGMKAENVLAGTLIGYLSAKTESILSYYFGSSKSGERKTELLALAEPVKPK
jgi:hypothetical protein